MRLVIELKRGEVPEVVLNNLYKNTQLQDTFGMNLVALVDGQPRLLNLKQLIEYFLQHRREVVTRRTVFQLRKARERGHVLEGLAVALANIDDFIAIIKAAPTPPVARQELMARSWDSSLVREMLARVDGDAAGGVAAFRPDDLAPEYGLQGDGNYRLSETQAQEILNMRLQRLTGLEQDKIIGEYKGRDGHHRRPARHPGPPGAHHHDHQRRAAGHQGRVLDLGQGYAAAPKSKSTPPSSIPKT